MMLYGIFVLVGWFGIFFGGVWFWFFLVCLVKEMISLLQKHVVWLCSKYFFSEVVFIATPTHFSLSRNGSACCIYLKNYPS